jgi:apolipoprotein N-acyltransferase
MLKAKITNPVIISIATASLMSWSWLLFVRVTEMSSSKLLGFVIATIAMVINTAICSSILLANIWYLKKRPARGFWQVIKVGTVWAFSELVAAWVVALVWFGKDASIDTLYPFTSLAHIAANTPIIFLSRFIGFFGLSAVLAMLIFATVSKKHRKYFLPLLAATSFFSIGAWWLYRAPQGIEAKTIVAAEKLGHQQPIEASKADLVVVPEYGLDDVNSSNLTQRIQSNGKEVYVVGSEQKAISGKINNLLTIGSTTKGITYQEAKTRLVPGGEYLPYSIKIPLRLLRMQQPLVNFEVTRAVVKGTKPIHPFKVNDQILLGSAVCSSIISTEDYRKLTHEGATLLTNSASLEIFNGSPIFTWQHTSLAKFMATANARIFVQSSNDGKSFIIDQNGKILASRWPVGTLEKTIITNTKKTPYTLIGEWVVVVGLGFILFDIYKQYRKNNAR